jgi:hypothetical protein
MRRFGSVGMHTRRAYGCGGIDKTFQTYTHLPYYSSNQHIREADPFMLTLDELDWRLWGLCEEEGLWYVSTAIDKEGEEKRVLLWASVAVAACRGSIFLTSKAFLGAEARIR